MTKVLQNLDLFYSILATIQYFTRWKSAIMDPFVTFRKRVYSPFPMIFRFLFICFLIKKSLPNLSFPVYKADHTYRKSTLIGAK